MNILLIGSGGREHALAYKITQSPLCDTLFISPGNAGMKALGTICALDVTNHEAVCDFVKAKAIELVVIGPEAPLVDGLADSLKKAGIAAFGPSQYAAQLEGSKNFTKMLCDKYNIPTAKYAYFDTLEAATEYVTQEGAPIVVKADGLAAGKGVTVAETTEQAIKALEAIFDGSKGAAVVIEECLIGEEASAFFLTDGQNILPIGTAQDHKRAFDGDQGPNTGGMGAYSPAPVLTEALQEDVLNSIVTPTVKGMEQEGHPYVGVLYAGLMLTKDGPKLIEYNCRFGDPECQVLMMRLNSDLVELMVACCNGSLNTKQTQFFETHAMTVVMAAKGYPGNVTKGTKINLPQITDDQAYIFHAGTKLNEQEQLLANGGRVLNVTTMKNDLKSAQSAVYSLIKDIDWDDSFYRKDIGWRALK